MSESIDLILKALKGFSIIAQEKLDDYVEVTDEESKESAEQIIDVIKHESSIIFHGLKEKVSDILLDEMNFATTYDIDELTKRIQKLENKIIELSSKIK